MKQYPIAHRSSPASLVRQSVVAAIAIAAFSAAGFAALSATPPPVASAHAKQGDAIFHKRCIVCHSKQPGDMSPFGPPNLHGVFDPGSQLKITPADAVNIITHGRGHMPSFAGTLSKSEIESVVAYLKTQ
ncbi:c-type cytochrome [Paracidobacterium acidisoli]|uniref:Cytochrome c n=1 Tax=Paracidobacterium acidisoli TaxID=2303751 RepID=A0A372ISV7_9BACT|nr:cytochrome c [Paracidobacterium acidisoli]MBT9330809.1 cytochrome c [Paracidobacterium acidisoli]